MVIDGQEVSWNELFCKKLKHLIIDSRLATSSIAWAFGVTVSKVRYKKRKLKLTCANILYEKFASENKELFDELNTEAKKWFLDCENIENMKMLNIYMVSHIAGLLSCSPRSSL